MPERVQMSRQRPWRVEHPDAVIVARPSKWGNPFKVGDSLVPPRLGQNPSVVITPELAVAAFRSHVASFSAEFGDYLHGSDDHDLADLAGRDLACWCPLDRPCHADVLLELANA
jgi:hypothetical protein